MGPFCVLSVAWAFAIAPTCPQGQDSGGGANRSLVIEEFEVLGDGDALLLPVDVNGRRYRFCLDTGCPLLIFDETLKGHQTGRSPCMA